MKKIFIAVIILVAVSAVALWRMQPDFGVVFKQQTRVMMTTYVTIFAYGREPAVSKAINRAFKRMQEVTDKFNAHNPESPLHAFNEKGLAIKDEEILKVVRLALEVSKQSEGAFDITVFPLVKLWGFYGEGLNQQPSGDKIKEALARIGYKHLILSATELRKDKEEIRIDLGGIAKGYVVSEGIKALEDSGVHSAIIQAGGDIYALGDKLGRAWRIGIRSPRKDAIIGYVEVANQAVMGSGDYERFFIKSGKRFSHIIDPRTGYPAKGASAVTIIYSDPTVADAWGPALLILGAPGLKIIENIIGMEAIMVTAAGEVLHSEGLKNFKRLSRN